MINYLLELAKSIVGMETNNNNNKQFVMFSKPAGYKNINHFTILSKK